VYLDAMYSSLQECRHGCARDNQHPCVHRFGPQLYVIAQQHRIAFTRLTDLQVILDFLHIILTRWKNGTAGVWGKRYVILTNDRRFLQHAEYAFRHERNMRSLPLRFRANGVTYLIAGYPWEINVEVHVLPQGAHHHDNLRDAIQYAQARLVQ
jgi:hypothetical protein